MSPVLKKDSPLLKNKGDSLNIGDCFILHTPNELECIAINKYKMFNGNRITIAYAISTKTTATEKYLNLINVNSFENTKISPIANLHFFTIDELSEMLINMKKIRLLGISYEYQSANRLNQFAIHIFIENNNKIIAITIPKFLDAKLDNHLCYVYVKSISEKAMEEFYISQLTMEHKPLNEIVTPEKLTIDSFFEFIGKTKITLSGEIHGVKLGHTLIYDFDDERGIICYGNGILNF